MMFMLLRCLALLLGCGVAAKSTGARRANAWATLITHSSLFAIRHFLLLCLSPRTDH